MARQRGKKLTNTPEYKYGVIFELHIADILRKRAHNTTSQSKRHMPYIPVEGAEPGDIFCPYIGAFIELKVKPKRLMYPDTGINTSVYKTYKEHWEEKAIDTLLLFADPELNKVYGNYITKLWVPYNSKDNGEYPLEEESHINDKENIKHPSITYFHLDSMEDEQWIINELCIMSLNQEALFKELANMKIKLEASK